MPTILVRGKEHFLKRVVGLYSHKLYEIALAEPNPKGGLTALFGAEFIPQLK